MQAATLIYNADSGDADTLSPDELSEHFSEAGYNLAYEPTESESDLSAALRDPEGLVVVAGGDGTVRGVICQLLESDAQSKPSLTILPLGTANNIGKTLGLPKNTEDLIMRLAEPERCSFDVGRIEAPWGKDYFIEGAGLGLYADMLTHYDPEEGKSVLRALGTVKDILFDAKARDISFKVDGEALSGSIIALEILNTQAIGPRLRLVSDASPSDGLFDIATVYKPEGVSLANYALSLLNDSFDSLENVSVRRGKTVEITWQGEPFHVDAEVRPSATDHLEEVKGEKLAHDGKIVLENLAGALELWLPAS